MTNPTSSLRHFVGRNFGRVTKRQGGGGEMGKVSR